MTEGAVMAACVIAAFLAGAGVGAWALRFGYRLGWRAAGERGDPFRKPAEMKQETLE